VEGEESSGAPAAAATERKGMISETIGARIMMGSLGGGGETRSPGTTERGPRMP
jgi:hypothetical protein